MKKDPGVFLGHILDSIEAIEQYSKGLSKEIFLANQEKQDAIIRRFEIIGEACNNLPKTITKKYIDVEWHKPIGMRNIITHEYFDLNLNLVWDTISKSLPNFKKQIIKILEEI